LVALELLVLPNVLDFGLWFEFQSYMPNFGVYLFLNNKLFFGELSEVNPQVAPSLPKTPFRVEEVDNL